MIIYFLATFKKKVCLYIFRTNNKIKHVFIFLSLIINFKCVYTFLAAFIKEKYAYILLASGIT